MICKISGRWTIRHFDHYRIDLYWVRTTAENGNRMCTFFESCD